MKSLIKRCTGHKTWKIPFSSALAGSFVGRYLKKLPLKINYLCIGPGIKQCDGPAIVKLQCSVQLILRFFTYSNLLLFFVCNLGQILIFLNIIVLNFDLTGNNYFFDES